MKIKHNENSAKYQDRQALQRTLVYATKQAQEQILLANGGTMTSEEMNHQIGTKHAAGYTIFLRASKRNGYAMQFVKRNDIPKAQGQ